MQAKVCKVEWHIAESWYLNIYSKLNVPEI